MSKTGKSRKLIRGLLVGGAIIFLVVILLIGNCAKIAEKRMKYDEIARSPNSREGSVITKKPSALNKPINPNQGNKGKPLDEWANVHVTCVNKGNSNVVDVEIAYDLNGLWASVKTDTLINIRNLHSRDKIHKATYFWICIYSMDNGAYVDGKEGEGNQFIGGYYWGVFAKKEGTPLSARLRIPKHYGPGRYQVQVKTRLGTWDYSWISPWRSSADAEFVVEHFESEL